MCVHAPGGEEVSLRIPRGVAVVSYQRDNFRPQAKQGSRISMRERLACGQQFAGTDELAILKNWRVYSKINERSFVHCHEDRVPVRVIGPTLYRVATDELNQSYELGVRVGMIDRAGRRTQAVEPHLTHGGPGLVAIQ